MRNGELEENNTFLNANYQKLCPICKKHMRKHSKEDYRYCMKVLSDEIKALPKAPEKPQEVECYLCVKGAPHHHDKPSACYLCLKNGKSLYFSNTEKYKKQPYDLYTVETNAASEEVSLQHARQKPYQVLQLSQLDTKQAV